MEKELHPPSASRRSLSAHIIGRYFVTTPGLAFPNYVILNYKPFHGQHLIQRRYKKKKISRLVMFSINSSNNKICEKILSGWLHSVRNLYKQNTMVKQTKELPRSIYSDCSSHKNLYELAWPYWCQSMMLLASNKIQGQVQPA